MSRRPALVTQADLNRAVKAAASAPVPMAVEISPDGKVIIFPLSEKKNSGDIWSAPLASEKEPEI